MAGRGSASYKKLATTEEDILQQENDARASSLSSKISTLKSIALDIDSEAKYQNKYLDGMGDDFGSASGLLGSSMKRLNNMVSSGSSNRKLMCYLILFLVTGFFIIWYVVGKVRS